MSASVKLAIIGCGDVVARRYLHCLAQRADDGLEVVACCDRDRGRALGTARACATWWPQPRIYEDVGAVLAESGAQAVLNLTPAPAHFDVSLAALEAGRHVYSEKPLASTLEQADRLIDAAEEHQRLLLCAPAVMAAPRFRWLREVLEGGRLGRPTLARGQIANLGPAAWRPYRGDPAPYYQAGVGPLLDEGVYLLHAVTGLLGPARRVQAIGAIAIPERVALSGPSPGTTITVTASDHVLVQLEFDDGRVAQLLSSFAVPASRAPTMEVHCTRGSVSLSDHLSAAGPVDVFVLDDGEQPVQGWMDRVAVTAQPPAVDDLVAHGALHFLACLRGEDEPILSAGHGRHVLEIALAVGEARTSGETVDLSTRFGADLNAPIHGRTVSDSAVEESVR